MENTNIKNIANHIKTQLPEYISSDEDYSRFVKFLELYYEWMSASDGVSGVTQNITDYTDIDETLDVFVSLFKNELAGSFPNVTKIKGGVTKDSEYVQINQEGNNTETAIESLFDQEFLGTGNQSTYKMSYFNPFYYFGETSATHKINSIRVFRNAAGSARGDGTTLTQYVNHLTPPETDPSGSTGDYTLLTESIDGSSGNYILKDNFIKFIDVNGDPTPLVIDDIIKIRFTIHTWADPSTKPNTEDGVQRLIESVGVKKTTYENQKQFLKFMKDFYQSKGTEKSYDFLFRSIFNEDIEIYYPKNNIFKSSNNNWNTSKSLRAIPYVPTGTQAVLATPYMITGKTSLATATVESRMDMTLGTYPVRQYYITNIVGEFSSKETIKVSQTDNTTYEETLYECVTGFNITDGGSDYSINQPLHYNLTSEGSGYGFSAKIEHTSNGPVEQLDIVARGDGYITGEEILFNDGGTFGTGAVGLVSETTSTNTAYNVSFLQNPVSGEYPVNIWDINLSGNPYHDTAANTLVKIENIDAKDNDVFGLFAFENHDDTIVHEYNDMEFDGHYTDNKQNFLAMRHKTRLTSVANPPADIVNINEGDPTETRYKSDLNFTISSVDSDGAITGVTIPSTNHNATSILPASVNLSNMVPQYNAGIGFGALFDYTVTDGVLALTLSSSDASRLYNQNDIIKISGSSLSIGTSPINDVLVRVDTVADGQAWPDIGPLNHGVPSASDYVFTPSTRRLSNTAAGTGAVWDVDTRGPSDSPHTMTVRLSDADSNGTTVYPTINYAVGDKFVIPGTRFTSSGVTPDNDLTIIVTQVDDNGRIQEFSHHGRPVGGRIASFSLIGTPTVVAGSSSYYNPTVLNVDIAKPANEPINGSGVKFFVSKTGTTYNLANPSSVNRGQNYAVGTTFIIRGNQLGGATPANDLTFKVSKITLSGGIREVDTIGTNTAANTFALTNISGTSQLGTDAKFNIAITGSTYSNCLTVADGGKNYQTGQSLTFKGSALANQWVKDGFSAKLSIVGDNALHTDHGYARINDVGQLFNENSTGGVSLDFWYFRKSQKLRSGSSGSAIFSFNDHADGTQRTTLWQYPDGTIRLQGADGSAILTITALEFGVWHHVAVYFGATETTLYLDGIKKATTGTIAFDIAEYGDKTSTFTATANQNTHSLVYDPLKVPTVTLTRTVTTGGAGTTTVATRTLESNEYVSTSGTAITFLSTVFSANDIVNISYSTPQKNFYLGARQVADANYIVDDYTLGFFGTLRFTKGRRYEEQASAIGSAIQDTGTDNAISGQGLSPIYVNPVPSSKAIRNSRPVISKFTVTDATKATYTLEYDALQVPIIDVTNTVVNLVGDSISTTTELAAAAYTATSGSVITFSPNLTVGDEIEITSYALLSNDLEYIVYNSTHPTAANKISLRKSAADGTYSTHTLEDAFSLSISWEAKSKSPISKTSLITGGSGYRKFPQAYVKDKSNSYRSTGEGAFFIGKGENIGKISKIKIQSSPLQTQFDGFGVGYDTPPTLDLSSFGDGTAAVTVLTGPLCEDTGSFLNDEGFLSHDNRLYDGYLWQDYSYVIKVGRYIDEWRKIVKKVVHPAGLMMFGEYSITSTALVRKGAGIAWTELFYEIIKNVNMKVKNMDGLGRWAYAPIDNYWYPTIYRQDTNYLNSQGHTFVYDNRQRSINSTVTTDGVAIYDGVGVGEISDDTVGAATVDSGSGRYALLMADETTDATHWSDVFRIALNYSDSSGKDYSHYYRQEIIGNTITIYDTSDAEVTSDEWLNTRPWGKYEITGVLLDNDIADRYVVLDVVWKSGFGFMPNHTGNPGNTVEFRWDNIFRGNVDRGANHWIGSQRDGANPRDEKMIINISGRFNNNKEGDVPTLHTTYKSLERFKFYFSDTYPWQKLSHLFSPPTEAAESPYWNMRNWSLKTDTLTHVLVRANQYNMWYNLPIEIDGKNEWVANTDGTDHNWRNTRISDVITKSDRKYKAVLDSEIRIRPIYLVMSEENPNSGTRKRMGPTNLSVERAKFNDRLQSLDYNKTILSSNEFQKFQTGTYHDKTNFAVESTVVKYTTAPTTIAELSNILDTTATD